MKITREADLKKIAFVVCSALEKAKITAVLTGGSAATIWSKGAYQSHDCDFVITFHEDPETVAKVLSELGFARQGRHFYHSDSDFAVEFPPGPLAIGDEPIDSWETLHEGEYLLHILNPTDSCKDRLAAYYHWDDFSSFEVAVRVALFSEVDMDQVQLWSESEDSLPKFKKFKKAVEKAKRAASKRNRGK